MKTKEKIYPEDVILEKIQKTFLKAPDGRLYSEENEELARNVNCTVTKCSEDCENDAQFKKGLCRECSRKREKERYFALVKTTDEYPCIIGDQYFWNEDELFEYLEEDDLNTEDVFAYGCEQKEYPKLDSDYYQEYTNQDGELPEQLEKLIEEFNEKLKDVPMLWWEDSTTRFIIEKTKQ